MPHQNISEGWVDSIVGGLLAVLTWFARMMFGRYTRLEERVAKLEQQAGVMQDRHTANLERLERIDQRSERIEHKLDRIAERF